MGKSIFKTRKQEEETTSDLKKRFEEVKSKEVAKTDYTVVNLRMIVGCGCGGSSTKIHAVVPNDSDFLDAYDNGDRIDVDDVSSFRNQGIEFYKGHVSNPNTYDSSRYERI